MENIEYAFNELENEAVSFSFGGKTFISAGGPEKTRKPGAYWSPAFTGEGEAVDLYWAQSGNFGGCDFYTLTGAEIACLE